MVLHSLDTVAPLSNMPPVIVVGYQAEAVQQALRQGFCFTMAHPVQNQLASLLVQTIPCAEMVSFLVGGSDVTSAAVRIARIHTGRDKVVRWGYHGWHDWCCPDPEAGIPPCTREDVMTFDYNDLGSLEKVVEKFPAK